MKLRSTAAAVTRAPRRILVVALAAVGSAAAAPPAVSAQSAAAIAAAAAEPVDLNAVRRIKEEAFQRSQVMEVMSYLTDVYGPRLTGSPYLKEAEEWAAGRLREWGLSDVHLEKWGRFGRGWTNRRFSASMVSPRYAPLIGYPKAWTPGTDGPVRAPAVLAVIDDETDLESFRGKLAGKFVLWRALPDVEPVWDAPAHRLTEAELRERAEQPSPRARARFDFAAFRARRAFARRVMGFFRAEGVAAVLEPSRSGSGGTVFVSSGGSQDPEAAPVAPQVVLAVEHYGRIYRILEKGIPVVLEIDIQNIFDDSDMDATNVVAEIPGTDKAEEVVMLGGHFDSWHAGTGATDNAAGSATMMEAMRILKATGLPLRRTVRLALWTGEEQGLLGSRAYVKAHFGDPETMKLKPEHAGLSGYFNVDNGGGAIRGVYLQGNDAIAPVFARWMEPFRNMDMTTLSIRDTGGTDHLSFDAVGLPGFQFIQDPLDYGTRTHHSNMDVYERIVPRDMMFNAAIVASFIYHAANREALLPREPLPEPRPRRRF
ncbi:MAG: M20/M25/M40 family metallo-hydrolase [Gemmatimonadota bacterium]